MAPLLSEMCLMVSRSLQLPKWPGCELCLIMIPPISPLFGGPVRGFSDVLEEAFRQHSDEPLPSKSRVVSNKMAFDEVSVLAGAT